MVQQQQALPEQYFKQALKPVLKQIELSFFLKRKFSATALQLHLTNASHTQRIKTLLELLGDKPFTWSKGKALLEGEGTKPTTTALLKLFVENTSFNTYRFYRRELMIEQLKADKECRIRVDVSVAYADKVSPCGRRHGEILDNTKDNLKQIPPCDELRCACDWDWIDPE